MKPIITGDVVCTGFYNDNGDTVDVTAEWRGGDVVGISDALLAYSDERWIRREGDIIHICQFRVRVFDHWGDVWYAQRIDDTIDNR